MISMLLALRLLDWPLSKVPEVMVIPLSIIYDMSFYDWSLTISKGYSINDTNIILGRGVRRT
jgi:hypothetical protein